MKELKIKVCGMREPENILQLAMARPDYVGFIFYQQSSRYFTADVPPIAPGITTTGVFVDAPLSEIQQTVEKHHLGAVQLHGSENPDFCRRLRGLLGQKIEIIKAFPIQEKEDFAGLPPYEPFVDFFLFDTKGPLKGGNGKTFDWNLLLKYSLEKPFFLSGGIAPGVAGDIRALAGKLNSKRSLLYGVDLNSCFEERPGLKKIDEIKKFKEALTS